MLAALLLATAVASQGPNLDAPIDMHPTLRTEINRGYEAAFNCSAVHYLSMTEFDHCVIDAIGRNKQKLPDATPFTIGAYLFECEQFATIISGFARIAATNPIAQAELPNAQDRLASIYRALRRKQLELGLSDAQLVDSIKDLSPKGKSMIAGLLQGWEQSPPRAP